MRRRRLPHAEWRDDGESGMKQKSGLDLLFRTGTGTTAVRDQMDLVVFLWRRVGFFFVSRQQQQ